MTNIIDDNMDFTKSLLLSRKGRSESSAAYIFHIFGGDDFLPSPLPDDFNNAFPWMAPMGYLHADTTTNQHTTTTKPSALHTSNQQHNGLHITNHHHQTQPRPSPTTTNKSPTNNESPPPPQQTAPTQTTASNSRRPPVPSPASTTNQQLTCIISFKVFDSSAGSPIGMLTFPDLSLCHSSPLGGSGRPEIISYSVIPKENTSH